jgi:hypothetical protein
MRSLLLATTLLLAACGSSDAASFSPLFDGGAGRNSATVEVTGGDGPGSSQGGGASSSNEAPAGEAGEPSAASANTGGNVTAGAGGKAPGTSGAPSSGSGGQGGAGGASGGGAAGGGAGGLSGGGAGGAGGAGGSGGPDPCASALHWNPKDRWDDNAVGVRRQFAGKLWECQAADYCRYFPGNGEPNGWAAIAECPSGPATEAACQCEEGACCDGCYFRPSSYFCGEVARSGQCLQNGSINLDYWNLFCTGDSTGECTRWGAHTKYGTGPCPDNGLCQETGDLATCVTD